MSQITICDICGERIGVNRTRLTVASGPAHPHTHEEIAPERIDVCRGCLLRVPDLSSALALHELRTVVKQATHFETTTPE
jgi:hypothetical protein